MKFTLPYLTLPYLTLFRKLFCMHQCQSMSVWFSMHSALFESMGLYENMVYNKGVFCSEKCGCMINLRIPWCMACKLQVVCWEGNSIVNYCVDSHPALCTDYSAK